MATRIRFAWVFGYRGPGRKFGVIRFANGFTLRVWPIALHVWRLRDMDFKPKVVATPKGEPVRGLGNNSTPEMRARIRELATPEACDYDRAVIAALDDLDIAEAAARFWRDQRDVQNQLKHAAIAKAEGR